MPSGIYERTKPVSLETREKMSKARKGRKHSWGYKISIAKTGISLSAEHRKNISKSHLGQKPWNAGKRGVYSLETIAKMSRAKFKGILTIGGYKFIYSPQHPFCMKCGYVSEAQLIVEKCLGRFLDTNEIIHHINLNKKDNSPENLFIFETTAEHTSFHRNLKYNDFLKTWLDSNLIKFESY